MRERTVSVRAVAIGWALVACGMAQAENLGRIGPTYPIGASGMLRFAEAARQFGLALQPQAGLPGIGF